MTGPAAERSSRAVEYLVAGLGVLLLLAELPFFFASGLLAPLWGIVLLLAFWLAMLVVSVRLFRRQP